MRSLAALLLLAVCLFLPAASATAGTVVATPYSAGDSQPLCGSDGARADLYQIVGAGRQYLASQYLAYDGVSDTCGALAFTDAPWVTITDGTYEVEANAHNHLVERRRVNVLEGFGDAGTLYLAPSPIVIEVVTAPSTVSAYGGPVKFTYRVWNMTSEELMLMAHTEVCGPGETVSYTCVDALRRVSFTLAPGGYRDFRAGTVLDADQPDDWFTGVITVHAWRDGWSPYGQLFISFKKGGPPAASSLPEERG